MIRHLYSTDDGEVIEEWFNLGEAPEVIVKDGKVFKYEYGLRGCRLAPRKGYPIYETASAVLPEQKAEAEQYCRDQGCPTEFVIMGNEARPKLDDPVHRADYHRTRGFFDRDGGYSDAQKT